MSGEAADPAEPRRNAALLGHAAAERAMRDAALGGRLHHAWLIGGPPGIGKATLAFRFARALLAGFPGEGLAVPPADPVFRRVGNGTHADLAVLQRSWDEKRKRLRAEIVVDEVRAVAGFLSLTPAEGGWRVVLVDGAEHLNRTAANALLKVLEEPPPRALLLLASSAPGRLLPTIRSRCRALRLAPLSAADVASVLRARRPDLAAHEVERLAADAGGSPRRALEAASGPHAALADAAEEAARRGAGLAGEIVPDAADIALADRIARAEDGFERLAALLRAAMERRARALAGEDPSGAAAAAAASLALGALRDQTVRFNLDKRQAILAALHCVRTP